MNIYSLCISFILFINFFKKKVNKIKMISLDFGRQTGKTTALINRYKHGESLIICVNENIKQIIIERLHAKYPHIKTFDILLYDRNFKNNLLKTNCFFKSILIDENKAMHELHYYQMNQMDFYSLIRSRCIKDTLTICLG